MDCVRRSRGSRKKISKHGVLGLPSELVVGVGVGVGVDMASREES